MGTQAMAHIAPLKNVRRFTSLLSQLVDRHPSLPGIGAFYGPSGFGKSTALIQAQNRFNAVAVEVGFSWTPRVLVDRIMHELGLARAPTVAEGVQAVITALAEEGRPLIIDEADHLLKKRFIELVREIHDQAGIPVVLVGEELMPAKLARWERVHNRVLVWEPAQKADLEDARLLAEVYCDGVEVDEMLLVRLVKETGGNTRRISTSLVTLREQALRTGVRRATLAKWKDTPLVATAPPQLGRAAS